MQDTLSPPIEQADAALQDSLDQAALSAADQDHLIQLETTIERGVVAVGTALAEIRDRRLYRATHDSFDRYCIHRWGFSRQRAHQHIEAAAVIERVSTIVDIPPPANEAQARPLAKLPKDQQADTWQEAVESAPDGKVTAKLVAAVVESRMQPPQDEPDDDQHDDAVDDRKLTDKEIQRLKQSVQKLYGSIVAAENAADRIIKLIGEDDDLRGLIDDCSAAVKVVRSRERSWTSRKNRGKPVEEHNVADTSTSLGVARATEAINILNRIPRNDARRKPALQMVRSWLRANP